MYNISLLFFNFQSFKHNHKLRSFYKMLATGVGFDGIEFVAAVEGVHHVDLPVYSIPMSKCHIKFCEMPP